MRLYWSSTHVEMAQIRAFGAVIVEPGVEIDLQGFDAILESLSHPHPEELAQRSAGFVVLDIANSD